MVTQVGQIRVDRQLIATETDVLSATDLDRAPGPGAIGIWAISSVADSTITVRIGAGQGASAIDIPTGTLIDTEQPPIAMQAVMGGEKIIVDVVEVTAMALHLMAIWIPA